MRINNLIVVFVLFLTACCGGSSSDSINSPAKPEYFYGDGFLPQCQTNSIIAASTNPQGSEIMALSGTGNAYIPDPAGKAMSLCSGHVKVHMTQTDFDNQVYLLHIDSETQGQVGSLLFNQMYCATYGQNVNVNTWVEGWGPFPPGFIDMSTSTFNLKLPFTDTKGNSINGVAEGGGNYGIAYGGELLVTDNPKVGQVIYDSATGQVSCTDPTPIPGSTGHWIQSTIDNVDRYGTAVHPIVNTALYETTWGNVFNYTDTQYVGTTDYIMANLDRNSDGSFKHDANGNLIGTGYHYRAVNTARLQDTAPNAPAPKGWHNS